MTGGAFSRRGAFLGIVAVVMGLLVVFAWTGRAAVPVTESAVPAGLALTLDVDDSNGLCNDGAGADKVDNTLGPILVGTTHKVGICLSGQPMAPNAFTAVVEYNPGYDPMTGLPAGGDLNLAPEIVGVDPALDDNPDANQQTAGPDVNQLGTGWQCLGGIVVVEPYGDDPATANVSDSSITCDGSGGADTQTLTASPGLLATIDYTATNAGTDILEFTGASNVFAQNCGVGAISCTGVGLIPPAEIEKIDSADLGVTKNCVPAIGVAGGTIVCTLNITNAASSSTVGIPRLVDNLPGGSVATTLNVGLSDPFCGTFISNIVLCEVAGALGPLAPGANYNVTIAYDVGPGEGGKTEVNAALVFDGPPLAIPPIFAPAGGTPDPNFTPLNPLTPSAFANLFNSFLFCISDRYDGTPFDTGSFVDLLPGAECNNAALAANPIAPADLSGINKSGVVAPQPPSIGDTVTWTVNVPNSGLSPAPAIILKDTVGANQTLTGATVAGTGIGAVVGTDAQCGETGTTSAGVVGDTATCTLDVDNDSDGLYGEDPADDDADGGIDEDAPGDDNGDGCPGLCFIDDDSDGSTDEGAITDDDEDGASDEDQGTIADDNDGDLVFDEDDPGQYALGPGDALTMTVTATLDALALECTNHAEVTYSDPVTETTDGSVLCTVLNVTMYKDKHPETAERDNVVNLWICEPAWAGGFLGPNPPGQFGPNVPSLPPVAGCNENGEGRLLVAEVITSVFDPEGIGAFEVQIKYDHKIFDINVEDSGWLYSTGRVPGIAGCDLSIFNENAILFGCVSKNPQGEVADPAYAESGAACAAGNVVDDDLDGRVNDGCPQVGANPEVGGDCLNAQDDNDPAFDGFANDGCPIIGIIITPGPTGDGVLGVIEVLPEGDLKYRLHPGQQNGIVRRILDENCEAADIYGDPLASGNPPELLLGIAPGGLVEDCDDLDVTVRILEADLDLNCIVDVLDDQAIAFRYGAFFGSLLYDPWYDLEPALKDFDIDIKDIQKVFGRNGSTCSQSGLPEDGTFPAQEPEDALSNGPL
jgi:uncharacterized repeat protein (TIGR01451 family)